MDKKRILIIAAGEWQVPVIKKAQSMGLEVVTTDKNPSAPGLGISDYSEIVDIIDLEGTLKVAQKYKVDAVITEQTDISVPTAAYVAEKMSLPGIGYDVAIGATNKWIMREKCRQGGIPVPDYRKVQNLTEALDAANELGFPAIVKPVDGQSSRGVGKVENMQDLMESFLKAKKFSREGSVLVEEFMVGAESSAEGFVADGEIYVFGVCDKTKCLPPHRYDIRLIYPAKYSQEIVERIVSVNRKVVRVLGIKMGITHAEFMVTKDGPKLIEIAARGCGSKVASDLIPAITGVDITKAKINQALAKPFELNQTMQKFGILEFLLLPQGKVRTISGLDRARRMEGVIDVFYHVKVGDRVGVIDCGRDRPGYLLGTGETREEVINIAQKVKETVRVEMEARNAK